MESILSTFEIIIIMLMGTQAVYSFSLFLLGDFYLKYYEYGTFSPPENAIQKMVNIGMDLLMGVAIYFYKKQQKYSWPIRKLLQLITPFVMSIVFFVIFQLTSMFLRMVFL
ncbi:hypothetical protein [Bacillus massilinigeriensis]|uniref:hypothetical protein n=1 Tax=Bacillus mediterraneensis TaxID=1805474 RepID=UPI0008F8CF18|nr:hypothetical protein [Bacillus mediterraneensis]